MGVDKPHIKISADKVPTAPVNDSLSNVVANLGTQRDKRFHNIFGYGTPATNWVELEGAYVDNWIARQIVNVPVDDGLREWRKFECEQSEEIEAEEKRLNLVDSFTLANYWARLYGGSVLLMITGQPLDKPLRVESIKKGGLKRLVVLDRWDIQPQTINFTDPIAADYLMPEFYRVTNGSTPIHSSHLIRLDGEPLPRRMRALNEGWGDSTLRKVIEDVKDVTATKGGIASLVLEANVDTIKREGLSDELTSGDENIILKRFALAGQMKSLVNTLLLDGSETYERKSLTFSGLSQILEQFMVWMSGAADIPMTRLFGRSAAGLNSTGEGDMSNYYDSIASLQESRFRPAMDKLDQVMIRSAIGFIPDSCEYEWNPLYQQSELEMAQQELAEAQAEELRLQQGIIKASHVMLRLKANGKYAITEEEIQKMQDHENDEELFGADDPLANAYANESAGGEVDTEKGKADQAE